MLHLVHDFEDAGCCGWKVEPNLTPVYIMVAVPSVSCTVVPDQQPEASDPPLVGLMAMGSCLQWTKS